MPATPAWLAAAEAVLNRGIDASGRAAALAHRLEGTAMQVDVQHFTRIRACIFRGRLALHAGADAAAPDAAAADVDVAPADAIVSGSPAALLQLFNGRGVRGEAASPGSPGIAIRGDAEIAGLYRELLLAARPDAEEELSRWVGDFPARRISQLAQRALGFARRARRTFGENLAEYLQEEGRYLVNRTELDEFLHGVDRVRETADRVEIRLARLEQRLKEPS